MDDLNTLIKALEECKPTQDLVSIAHFILVTTHNMKGIRVWEPEDKPFTEDGIQKWRGHSAYEVCISIDDTHHLYYHQTVQELIDACKKRLQIIEDGNLINENLTKYSSTFAPKT